MTVRSRPNDPDTVCEIMRLLSSGGAACLLFGGWAEEALGLRAPGPHRDIDLLLPAESFQAFDALLAADGGVLCPVPLKRFAHKRAILFGDVLVELTLVQQIDGTPCTMFWGDVAFEWNAPLSVRAPFHGRCLPTASHENLRLHRTNFQLTQPWRWRDPAVKRRRPSIPAGYRRSDPSLKGG